MRPIDVLLLTLSGLIILVIGLFPLFGSTDMHEAIRSECELFYEAAGPAAIAHCIAQMQAERSSPPRP
jgi:hypothetical protein